MVPQTQSQDGQASVGGVGVNGQATCENDDRRKESLQDKGNGPFSDESGPRDNHKNESFQDNEMDVKMKLLQGISVAQIENAISYLSSNSKSTNGSDNPADSQQLPSSLGEEDIHTLNWRKTWEKIDRLEAENKNLLEELITFRMADPH